MIIGINRKQRRKQAKQNSKKKSNIRKFRNEVKAQAERKKAKKGK